MELQPEPTTDIIDAEPEVIMDVNETNEQLIKQAIEKLEPSFDDYESTKTEKLSQIKRPIIHGTGSLALKGIIASGMVIRSGDEVMGGERATISQGNKDTRPISFAEFDADGKGEATAHFYALLAAGNPELIINEAQIRHQNVVENYMAQLGPEALENGIRKKLEREAAESLPDDNPELSLDWLRKDAEQKFKLLSQEGAYSFNPDRVRQNIEELQKIIDGQYDDPELLGDKLLELGIVSDLRYYYHPKGTLPEPWSKLPELLKSAVEDVKDPDSVTGRNFRAKLQVMRQKLAKYENLSPEEQEAIADQYPCVILVEGDGLELEEVNWMVTCQELHAKQNIEPSKIRQIRVPFIHVEQVMQMLTEAGLTDVEVIPFEYFEMERLIDLKP